MKPYTIRYLATAQRDLREIFDYVKRDNPAAAAELLEQFDKTIGNLAQFPLSGSVPKDERLRKLGYRVLMVGRYLVFYVVKAETVQIRRILHGARQYRFLL
ncbi:MAG: type II toxin-antitoxin system RelE/ParE family toxin [Microthrixaceae bacterium]